MKEIIELDVNRPESGCQKLLAAWQRPDVKVVVVNPTSPVLDVRGFYEGLFPYLGRPAFLAEDATVTKRNQQRTGEIWMQIRYDPSIQNAYRHSANAQPLHTDGSYIPDFPNSSFLACVANSGEGGETVFIDSLVLVEVLAEEAPELLQAIQSHKVLHSRSGDQRSEEILKELKGNWLLNWNYYCVSDDNSKEVICLSEDFQQFLLNSKGVEQSLVNVKLEPGQAVMWKDSEVLHGRNAFSADKAGERFIWKCAFDIGTFN